MDRINRIIAHRLWQENMNLLCALEQDREFCRHDITHLLDVARLAYIEALEAHLEIPRELIYAAALLHDLGRGLQYREGIPHDQAGAGIAACILPDCEFSPEETAEILSAIRAHRREDPAEERSLAGLICRADRISRICSFCPARENCNWSDEKKNQIITR